jgi:hypothetical protein
MQKTSTNVAYKSFIHGNSATNASLLREWIAHKELSRDQIVSITLNETGALEQSSNMMTIWYREDSTVKGSVPFEELKFS